MIRSETKDESIKASEENTKRTEGGGFEVCQRVKVRSVPKDVCPGGSKDLRLEGSKDDFYRMIVFEG